MCRLDSSAGHGAGQHGRGAARAGGVAAAGAAAPTYPAAAHSFHAPPLHVPRRLPAGAVLPCCVRTSPSPCREARPRGGRSQPFCDCMAQCMHGSARFPDERRFLQGQSFCDCMAQCMHGSARSQMSGDFPRPAAVQLPLLRGEDWLAGPSGIALPSAAAAGAHARAESHGSHLHAACWVDRGHTFPAVALPHERAPAQQLSAGGLHAHHQPGFYRPECC